MVKGETGEDEPVATQIILLMPLPNSISGPEKSSIYTEAAAKDGKITGYTKPIIKNLKVVNWEKDKDKPLKIAYEAVVGAIAWIFKNHNKEQLATKVEFEGNIKNPNIDIWELIGQV